MRDLGRRVIKWRVGWIWYVAAVAIPVLAHVITIGVNRAMGAAAPSFDALQPWFAVVVVVAVRMINPLDGPMAEEPSYRGFALPTLQSTRSPLVATTILAALVTVWACPALLHAGVRPAPDRVSGDNRLHLLLRLAVRPCVRKRADTATRARARGRPATDVGPMARARRPDSCPGGIRAVLVHDRRCSGGLRPALLATGRGTGNSAVRASRGLGDPAAPSPTATCESMATSEVANALADHHKSDHQ